MVRDLPHRAPGNASEACWPVAVRPLALAYWPAAIPRLAPMYVPSAFQATDPLAVVRAEPFATLVSLASGEAAHVPLLVRSARPLVLLGHVAAASPLAADVRAGAELLAVFSGPHGYVSPRDYATGPSVPTWNYVATHIRGRPRVLDDDGALAVLDALAARFEPAVGGWSRAEAPDDLVRGLLRGIVAFDLEASHVDGKAKLSQNRSPADRDAAIEAVRVRAPELAALMAAARDAR